VRAPGPGNRDSGLIGRDAELSRLRGLVDPPPAESGVLVVLGEAGMGKTVLLAEVTALARDGGTAVLSVAGRGGAGPGLHWAAPAAPPGA
jgi:hypothetical protein